MGLLDVLTLDDVNSVGATGKQGAFTPTIFTAGVPVEFGVVEVEHRTTTKAGDPLEHVIVKTKVLSGEEEGTDYVFFASENYKKGLADLLCGLVGKENLIRAKQSGEPVQLSHAVGKRIMATPMAARKDKMGIIRQNFVNYQPSGQLQNNEVAQFASQPKQPSESIPF